MSLVDALVVCAGIALFLTVPMYVARGLTGLVDRYRPASRLQAIDEATEPRVTVNLERPEADLEPSRRVAASSTQRASELVDAFVDTLIDEMVIAAHSAVCAEPTAASQRRAATTLSPSLTGNPVRAKTTIP